MSGRGWAMIKGMVLFSLRPESDPGCDYAK